MSTWIALLGVIWLATYLVVFIATWACMRAASISDRKHEGGPR